MYMYEIVSLKFSLLTRVGSSFQQLMKERHHEVKETRTAKNMHHELVVELKHLPEDDEEFLSEEDLLDGVGEVGPT